MNHFIIDASQGIDDSVVVDLKDRALNFLNSCRGKDGNYCLTTMSDSTAFTNAFAIFLFHLLGELDDDVIDFTELAGSLVKKLYEYKVERESLAVLKYDKYFMQLFAFVLSALSVLNKSKEYPLDDLISFILPDDMIQYLNDIGSLQGVPQSGNLAMCMGVFSIYAYKELNMGEEGLIDDWVVAHAEAMNANGFWGKDDVTHLQFQNGYHQYEIFEYLGVDNHNIENAVNLVIKTADSRGQFAPYFGGSGCYDYDAVAILTDSAFELDAKHKDLLIQTGNTILSEWNTDGGFSESQWIRPITIKSIINGVEHVFNSDGCLRKERARYFASMMLSKNASVNTHWTKYSRQWSESNLWDTWFRLLTIARIDVALNSNNRPRWGFIDFPGIGFHHSI